MRIVALISLAFALVAFSMPVSVENGSVSGLPNLKTNTLKNGVSDLGNTAASDVSRADNGEISNKYIKAGLTEVAGGDTASGNPVPSVLGGDTNGVASAAAVDLARGGIVEESGARSARRSGGLTIDKGIKIVGGQVSSGADSDGLHAGFQPGGSLQTPKF